MEWSKLKNIILLLLVSVNAFLLILVGVQESRAARYEEDTRQAAVRVLEQSGITFGLERVPQEAGLPYDRHPRPGKRGHRGADSAGRCLS